MKCKLCSQCDGKGCIEELPGMGGVQNNENFQLNCAEWTSYKTGQINAPAVRLAPITGAIQNVGYNEEKPFYLDLLESSYSAGLRLSIGDGAPDEKIKYGIEALNSLNQKGAVFIKPYSNEKIFQRMDWSRDVTDIQGVDIDSHKIKTMSGQAVMFPKSTNDLKEIKKYTHHRFAIKGIFMVEDITMLKEVKPDIAVISNHGGRISTRKGSTVEFLEAHHKEISRYCGELWVDGGIRRMEDLFVAGSFGVSEVMIGRPVISALLKYGKNNLHQNPFLAELSRLK